MQIGGRLSERPGVLGIHVHMAYVYLHQFMYLRFAVKVRFMFTERAYFKPD